MQQATENHHFEKAETRALTGTSPYGIMVIQINGSTP
jgi:hypothetical protein